MTNPSFTLLVYMFILGVDINKKAIKIASKNLSILNDKESNSRYRLLLTTSNDGNSILKTDINGEAFEWDVIVSNPPYIPPSKYHLLPPSVKRWESKGALVGMDKDGLGLHRQIIDYAIEELFNSTLLSLKKLFALMPNSTFPPKLSLESKKSKSGLLLPFHKYILLELDGSSRQWSIINKYLSSLFEKAIKKRDAKMPTMILKTMPIGDGRTSYRALYARISLYDKSNQI